MPLVPLQSMKVCVISFFERLSYNSETLSRLVYSTI